MFEVGDVVRIKSWEQMEKEFGLEDGCIKCAGFFTPQMKDFCGAIMTIACFGHSYSDSDARRVYFKDNFVCLADGTRYRADAWIFTTDMIELVGTPIRTFDASSFDGLLAGF